jgi:hypothetical protein
VNRERIIERERRWAVPAAVVALFPLVLYIASIVIVQRAGLAGGSSEAEQIVSLHDHAGAVLFSSVMRAIGFFLLPIPMLYLFLATKARNPRVQAAMVGFVFVGPILFGAQGIVQAIGAGQAADEFVRLQDQDAEKTRSFKYFQNQVDNRPDEIDKVTIYTADDSLEVEQTGGEFYAVPEYPSDQESNFDGEFTGAGIDSETDSDSGTGPPDALATNTTDNDSTLQVSQGLLFPAVLGLVVLMVYLSLQALRAGLLTRFLGSLGMALGASMILILPIAVLAMLAWTGFVGLMFIGRIPSGRPPAWEAGEAIPWQRPGDEPPGPRGGDAIEGDATEVDGETSGDGQESSGPAPQKRKRKRRS